MQSPQSKNVLTLKVIIGIGLLAFGASHGITGFLANIGWYRLVGVEFEAWYTHPAYQSMCWFALGIALTMLMPLWWDAIRRKPSVT